MARQPQILDRRRIKERVDYFFRTGARSRSEVAEFARRMNDIGRVAVIGGMLRNLSLDGNRDFTSDVDFVVDCHSLVEFQRVMEILGGKQNRFGGFGISLSRWKVDVWPLQRTWAAVQGHVEVKQMDDLLKATFFNWDEIIYRVDQQRLITAKHYFDWLDSRLLEINLEPNPNPLGNAIRAIRYAWRWNAVLGPKLARHVYNQIQDHGWEELITADRKSFPHRIIESLDANNICTRLQTYVKKDETEPFDLKIRPDQPALPL